MFISTVITFLSVATGLRADQVEMQNGERFSGKVLSVSGETVVLQSETLGKINVPRQKVASLTFGNHPALKRTNAVSSFAASTNRTATATNRLTLSNADLSAALRSLGGNTNFIRQIRDQMLAGSPGAANKYDAMVNDLLSGKLNLSDIQREAKSAADQLRALKRDLGPDADSLDMYLDVLDGFLKETSSNTTPAPAAPPSVPAH
jgi:hypothetical protein